MNDHEATPERRPAAIPNNNDAGDPLQGLARVAFHAWMQTAQWTATSSFSLGRRLAEAATSPTAAANLARDFEQLIRRFSGEEQPLEIEERAASIRERGEELLRLSNDVNYEEEAHPAYAWMLDELAPDEARILRLLATDGPQPSVDVRTGGPLSILSSDLVASGLSMIGPRAGCRYVERVPAYLNNLFRLGLIWFSRESLPDPHRYQVIEAQPDVLEAMHSVRIPKIVRRSIQLTPFGEDFCREALGISAAEPTNREPRTPVDITLD